MSDRHLGRGGLDYDVWRLVGRRVAETKVSRTPHVRGVAEKGKVRGMAERGQGGEAEREGEGRGKRLRGSHNSGGHRQQVK